VAQALLPATVDQPTRPRRYRIGTFSLGLVSLVCGIEQKPSPLFTLIKKVLFRVAFGGFIVLQVVSLALLLAATSSLFDSDNFLIQGSLGGLAFAALFLIGAGSYFVFRRITREDQLRSESEKWLAEHRHPNQLQLKRRRALKRWALWIPTVIVVVVCVFLDETWPFASHLLHPYSGRLGEYRVSIPLTWAIVFAYGNEDDGNSVLVTQRYRGLLRAGSGLYAGRRLPFPISTMGFRSTRAGDPIASKTNTPISTALPFGNRVITCWEEPPPEWMIVKRYIACATPEGDFSSWFGGSEDDTSDFYRTLESTKPTK
jgi:hypothetical protein